MKKIFLLFLIIIALFANSEPIAEYKMDECVWDGTAGEIKDSSLDGIDNNGTIKGKVLLIDKGKICNSRLFNGGAIDIDDLNVSTAYGDKTTVSFWIYWYGTDNVMPFGWYAYDLAFTRGYFGFNTGNSDLYGIKSSKLLNSWHHIVAIFTNGDCTKNKLYIDGIEQKLAQRRINSQSTTSAYVSPSARIGGWKKNNYHRFRGKIDEVKIWNRELSKEEIIKIYNNEKAGKNYDRSNRVCRKCNPIVEYKMDIFISNKILDSSENEYYGKVKNGTAIDEAWLCKGSKFDGLDDYIKLDNFPKLEGSKTITAWIKTLDNSKSNQIIFTNSKIDVNGNYTLSLIKGGKIRFYTKGVDPIVLDSKKIIKNNKWYFVVAIYDYDIKVKRLIVYNANGDKLDDKNQTVLGTLESINGTANIGGRVNDEMKYQFKGYIDEVKVWNMALNGEEIKKIYNNERNKRNWDGNDRFCINNNPIAEYRMDECVWNGIAKEVRDSSLDNIDNSGTITRSVSITHKGKICNSGLFNEGAIDINNLNISTVTGDKTTVSFWMYWDSKKRKAMILFGWYFYDLALLDGYFGFNTGRADLYGISSNGLFNGWHHIVAVFTNWDYTNNKLYIDGVKHTLTQRKNFQDPLRGYVFPNARIGGWRKHSRYQFIGRVDEVKIWNRELIKEEIESIYNNEKSGRNYNGSNRRCPLCIDKFDAWDLDKNITNRAISTKIVNKKFNLKIAPVDKNKNNYKEFNGTVCCRVISDNYIGDWNKTVWEYEKEKNVTFRVDKAIKKAKVDIRWIEHEDKKCPLLDYNESNSTDIFAIRPDTFYIEAPSTIKAGEEFNITIRALDYNGKNTKDYNESIYLTDNSVKLEYNETKSECKTGTLKKISEGDFRNGEANITLIYNEVGDINITIKEINGSEFALNDNDDTNNSQRFIRCITKTMNAGVDHFKIDATYLNHNKDNNFTYLDESLNIASILELNITAKSKNNETLKNYNSKCYAKDILIDVSHNSVDDKIKKVIYKIEDTKGNQILEDKNISFIYKNTNFTIDNNGSTFVKVYINFDRDLSNPINPFEFNITQIDVNDTDANGSLIINKSARYYYGNLLLKDIITTKDNFTKSYNFLVYDNNESSNLKPSNNEILFNWHKNSWHKSSDGNVTKIVVSSDYNASNKVTGVDINVPSIYNGSITFNISKNENKNFVVVHLLSENLGWLWYSKFNEPYDISNNSTCLNHFCFTITWEDNKVGEVGSGKFSGTEANIVDINTTKRGVKIFR